jgi:threonine/homoserine/homoserine lactone efflux protein
MSDTIAAALPYAFAAMLAAPAVLVVAALIVADSRTPEASVWAFVAGAALLDLAFAALLYGLLALTGSTGNSGFAALFDIAIGVIFLAFGLLALREEDSPVKRAADRDRIERVARGGLRSLLVAGVAVQVINSDALVMFAGGVKEVAHEQAAAGAAIVAIGVSVAVMLVPYYLPALAYAVSPGRSRRLLQPMNEWILDHTRLLEVGLGLLFGVLFIVKGANGLG